MTPVQQPAFVLEPHPLLYPHTEEECAEIRQMFATQPESELVTLAEMLAARPGKIAAALVDPLRNGLEYDCWAEADRQLEDPDCDIQANFGWNRGGGKTTRALKRLCEAALAYPNGKLLVLGETEDSSIRVQQEPVWNFLKPYISNLNGKRHTVYKVNYTEAGGFTEGVLVLPNGTLIKFDTYNGDPGKYEGWEFGARLDGLPLKRRWDNTPILNIGVVCDESLTLQWLRMIARRVRYRKAKVIWPFTPVNGITPAVKEFVGTLTVERSAPAELLPNANVAGCPRGHMPVTGTPSWPRGKVIYFPINRQAVNGYYEIVKKDCAGRVTDYIERIAYGFARDNIGRAFPQFGPWNIVEEEHLPAVGTNYIFCDPHDRRAWFVTKVRITPGSEPDIYITGEWPDLPTHGEWAKPTERETSDTKTRGWDGDVGPAQWARVDGIVGYKQVFRALTRVLPGGVVERDPMRRALQVQAQKSGLPQMFEPIAELYIDSRAGPRPHIEEQGQTCTVWEFEKDHLDIETGETLDPIFFRMVSGERIDLNMIRELLACRRNQDGIITRPPRIFVVRHCHQHIWALENYTGYSGEQGASKDPIDNLRYIAGADLFHLPPGALQSWRPGDDDEEDRE